LINNLLCTTSLLAPARQNNPRVTFTQAQKSGSRRSVVLQGVDLIGPELASAKARAFVDYVQTLLVKEP
jgi:hypothetical protein